MAGASEFGAITGFPDRSRTSRSQGKDAVGFALFQTY